MTCSPVDISTSISLSSGNLSMLWARLSNLSVSPAMADNTTTTLSPFSLYDMTRFATFLILSMSATDVPPYF